jgi:putative ABC transport system permease protein
MTRPAAKLGRLLRLSGRRGASLDAEMDEEIASHLAMREADLVQRGMDPAAARAEAQRMFGDLDAARRRLHASVREREGLLRRREWFDSLRQDVAYAVRQARRAPLMTAVTVLTLGLAIGASSAMYTIVDHVVLRPLPYAKPNELVAIRTLDSARAVIPVVSVPDWADWVERNHSFAAVGVYQSETLPVRAGTEVAPLAVTHASASLFSALRIPMLVGRAYQADEEESQASIVVVSEALWRRALGSDSTLRTPLRIGDRTLTVVGVVPNKYAFPEGTEVWLPGGFVRQRHQSRNNLNMQALARLAPGVTVDRARADLDVIERGIRAEDPAALYSYGVDLIRMHEWLVQDAREYLEMLFGAVALLLLIACANIASATLARGIGRQQEVAVRCALGASRGRVMRQLLTEQMALAITGGALGIGLAMWVVRFLANTALRGAPRSEEIHADASTLAFGLGLCLLTGVLSGLVPALRVSRAGVGHSLSAGSGRLARGGRGLVGGAIVGAEVALAVVLVVSAGLLMRSFRTLVSRDLGYSAKHVITAEVALLGARYREVDGQLGYWRDALAAVGSVPGVEVAGLANWIPLGRAGTGFIDVEGHPDARGGAGYRVVSDDYLRALGIPLLAGRMFGPSDRRGGERVTLINQAMAERYWPGENPIGRRVRARSMESYPGPLEWLTVVGVVGNVRHWGFQGKQAPEHYVLYTQAPGLLTSMTIVARARGGVDQVYGAVRSRLASVDPNIPAQLGLLSDRVDASVSTRRFTLRVMSGFSVCALLLAALGVYGVFSFSVARRGREIAVRMALGAERWKVVALVIGAALRVAMIGAAAGLVAAIGLTRLLGALLFEVSPTDPAVLAVAPAVLLVVAVVASLIPARRAAQIEPAEALRGE